MCYGLHHFPVPGKALFSSPFFFFCKKALAFPFEFPPKPLKFDLRLPSPCCQSSLPGRAVAFPQRLACGFSFFRMEASPPFLGSVFRHEKRFSSFSFSLIKESAPLPPLAEFPFFFFFAGRVVGIFSPFFRYVSSTGTSFPSK